MFKLDDSDYLAAIVDEFLETVNMQETDKLKRKRALWKLCVTLLEADFDIQDVIKSARYFGLQADLYPSAIEKTINSARARVGV